MNDDNGERSASSASKTWARSKTGASDVEPLAVQPAGCSRLLNVGLNKTYELLNARELPSYYVGRSRYIPISAIKAYIARRLEAAGNSSAVEGV